MIWLTFRETSLILPAIMYVSVSWTTLCEDLQHQVRVSFHFNRADQRVLHIRKASKPEGLQEEIYRHLEADPRPGGTKRTII